jgi:DNA modification methylase
MNKRSDEVIGPVKGQFIVPPGVAEADERADALPQEEDFWRPPVRFGSVPVEKAPLGWDRRKGFRKLFPQVMLPLQVVERVSFGHPALEPNRLFWGDNLHVTRQLPSESIDLIYIDPPFFSGRQYNVIFGDQNELRSFSDIWEGGMPGYLIWLNARLFEMKRLLKKRGSIYVHLDWHAVYYVKAEMDRIFGPDCFRNEIIWQSTNAHSDSRRFGFVHQNILWYSRSSKWTYNKQFDSYSEEYLNRYYRYKDPDGRRYASGDVAAAGPGPAKRFGDKLLSPPASSHWRFSQEKIDQYLAEGRIFFTKNGFPRYKRYLDEMNGAPAQSIWTDEQVPYLKSWASEARELGYPTQKPEALLDRIILTSSNEGETVADFFCGGGTTAAVAQRLGRGWLACDQSRVAVAITADRLARQVDEQTGRIFPVPDFTIEHWGVYEARRLSQAPPDQFRAFVMRAFGAVPEERDEGIHGYKGAIPVWVGEANPKKPVTAQNVQDFANAIRKTLRYKQDNLRDGIMLAWAFGPDATEAAERLRRLEQTALNFIRLDMIRIDSPRFREHVTALSTDHADYENFLTFVQPPKVEAGSKRIAPRTYKFDVSETVILNPGAKIINVQWDFDHGKRFRSTPGYSFVRGSSRQPELQAQYEFPTAGKRRIACKVQDDMGGEGLWTDEIDVS